MGSPKGVNCQNLEDAVSVLPATRQIAKHDEPVQVHALAGGTEKLVIRLLQRHIRSAEGLEHLGDHLLVRNNLRIGDTHFVFLSVWGGFFIRQHLYYKHPIPYVKLLVRIFRDEHRRQFIFFFAIIPP